MPGIEDDLLVGVVGMERRDHALDRVVAEDGADSDLHAELELVPFVASWLKNGSYWRTGLPLLLKMVQPLPTQRGLTTGPPSTTGPGLGLNLLLNLAAEAVGVAEGDLELQLVAGVEIADVGFARDGGGERR